MTTVKHVLDKKGRDVCSIEPDASVFDALKLMADNDIGSLVVLEGDSVCTENLNPDVVVMKSAKDRV